MPFSGEDSMPLQRSVNISIQNVFKLFLMLGFLTSFSGSLSADEVQCLICEVKCLPLANDQDQTPEDLLPHRLRHCALASHSACPTALISYYREPRDLFLGVAGPIGTVWREISLKKQDGSRWALGAIDDISISPDGTTLLAREETGRFAVVRVLPTGYLAYSYQSSDYRQMEVGYDSRNEQDLLRVFEFPGSIRVLTNPQQPYIAMHGLKIESCCWLDQNRFLAISYEDGRIIQFDTHTMREQRTLRHSQWKWSRHTGDLEYLYKYHGKTRPDVEINLAATGESIYLKPIALLADQYLLFQEHSLASHLLDTKTGTKNELTLQSGYAVPVSETEFVIISQHDQQTSCQWIDVCDLTRNEMFHIDGLFHQKEAVGRFRLNDHHLSQAGYLQLLISEYSGSDYQYLSTMIQRGRRQKGPKWFLSQIDQSHLSEKNIKGAVFGPESRSIRYCQFPQIVELPLKQN